MRRLLVSRLPGETRVALLEEERLIDFRYERSGTASQVGAHILGRVTALAANNSGAFVALGRGPDGFLPLRKGDRLTEGQAVPVVITRDAEANKGPRLSRELRQAGRFIILLPTSPDVRVSRHMADKARRTALTTWARSKGTGMILRRCAAHVPLEGLERELHALLTDWSDLQKALEAVKAPALLKAAPDVVESALIDAAHLDEIIADDAEVLGQLRRICIERAPDLALRIVPHGESEPLFDHFDLEPRIEALLDPVVSLPSGGRLIIERTAALTAIDVDSGSTTSRGPGGAVHQANLEAADEIPRQMRLRNLGGAIAVDFAGESRAGQRQEVDARLSQGLADDPVPVHVMGRGPAGWLELIRERRQPALEELMLTPGLPHRNGESMAYEIIRHLLREARHPPRGGLTLSLSPPVAQVLSTTAKPALDLARLRLGCALRLQTDDRLPAERFDLKPTQE
ncbi:ribonuclease E/G [Magnetospira thiophila]